MSVLTGGVGIALVGLGLWAAVHGGNGTLLLCGGWLAGQRLAGALRRSGKRVP